MKLFTRILDVALFWYRRWRRPNESNICAECREATLPNRVYCFDCANREQPRYTHDCKKCIFLGGYGRYDLWWCTNRYSPALSSMIARYSSRDSDYLTSHPPEAFATPPPLEGWYRTALEHATEQGLYIRARRTSNE